MKAPPTYRKAMDAATQAVIATAKAHGQELLIPSILTEAAVRAYLERHRQVDAGRVGARYAETTRKLAAMAVGGVFTAPAMCRQSLHGRMNTARAIMENPDAKWAWDLMEGGRWLLQRLPDGAKPMRALKSPITLELVALRTGETRISKAITSIQGRGSLGENHRIVARKYLNEAGAQWSVRATNQGVRLTRTA